MIVTELYKGQGLGNQLFCYVSTRAIALRNGYEFGIMGIEKFKAKEIMDLDFGLPVIGGVTPEEGKPPTVLPEHIQDYYAEKGEYHPKYKCDIRRLDPKLLNIKDHTKIDGCMQSEGYFKEFRSEIKKWLKVKDSEMCNDFSDDRTCVINFRGGEFVRIKDAFLRKKYWADAVSNIKYRYGPKIKFIVITDDVITAAKFFPDYDVYHFSVGKDYSIINHARLAILSNSTFAFWPIWTSDVLDFVIAPKYWNRHNISDGFWSLGDSCYEGWNYQDRDGDLYTYDECISEMVG